MTWSIPWSLVASALAVLAAFGGPLPHPIAVPAIALTFGLTPGWIAVRHLAPGARPARAVLMSLVLSPLLVGGPATALLSWGIDAPAIAAGIAWVVAVLALVPSRRPDERDEPEGWMPWALGGAWAVLVAAFLLGNADLMTRSRGWFHAAVVLQIAQRGLPVENPFFAGLRLIYFWGYHVRAALWLALSPALSPWTPLLSAQIAGAVGTMLGLALLARQLGASARGQLAAVGLAAFGYAPFGWLWLLVHSVPGGPAAGHGLSSLLAAFDPGTLHASISFFGDKYFIPTPFALGYAAFLAFTLCLLDAIEQPRWSTWALVGLMQAALLFLHTVVGGAAALMGLGWAGWALARSRHTWERHMLWTFLGLVLAATAAVVALFPYLLVTSAGQGPGFRWGLDGAALRTWLLAGALYVVPAAIWLARRAAAPGPARELWGCSVALTLAALCIGLPPAGRSQMFGLLFLLLSAPAALKVLLWLEESHGARRAVLAGTLVLAMLPTVVLAGWAFVTEARRLPQAAEAPQNDSVRQAYEWASRNTPPDAVFVDPEERLGMAVVAGRSALWGGDRWAEAWDYDDASLERRHRAVQELATGEPSHDTEALLRELGRPVVLVYRKFRAGQDPATYPGPRVHPAAGRWSVLYENEGVILYRWKGVR